MQTTFLHIPVVFVHALPDDEKLLQVGILPTKLVQALDAS